MSGELSGILRDALLVVVKEIPVAGSLVDYFERRKAEQDSESIRQAFESFARELSRLSGRLVDEIEGGSELERRLSEVTTQVAIIARRSHSPAKLDAAARLMANALLRDGDLEWIEHAERQLFLNALESLSDGAITLLAKAHHALGVGEKRDLERRLVRLSFADLRRHVALDESLLMGLVAELDRFNLLRRVGAATVRGPTGLYDNDPIEITPLAGRFVRFVASDQAGVGSES